MSYIPSDLISGFLKIDNYGTFFVHNKSFV